MRQTQTLTKSLSAGYQMFLCTNISSSLRDISPKLKVNSTFCEHWALFQKERKVGRREEERRKEKKGKERNGYFTPTAISLFRIKILQSPSFHRVKATEDMMVWQMQTPHTTISVRKMQNGNPHTSLSTDMPPNTKPSERHQSVKRRGFPPSAASCKKILKMSAPGNMRLLILIGKKIHMD